MVSEKPFLSCGFNPSSQSQVLGGRRGTSVLGPRARTQGGMVRGGDASPSSFLSAWLPSS